MTNVNDEAVKIVNEARDIYENHKGDGAWIVMEQYYVKAIEAAMRYAAAQQDVGKDLEARNLYEALKAAAYYIERLEAVQQRKRVRDMTEAMEHYHRTAPALIEAYERS